MKDVKQCSDCKFSKVDWAKDLICERIDPLTGVPIEIPKLCSTQRSTGWFANLFCKYCGKAAKYFEAK